MSICEYYDSIIRGAIFTLPKARMRFEFAAANTQNRTIDPGRYTHGATLNTVLSSDDVVVVYLEPEESGDVTYNRLAGGKFEYHAFRDIDRYLLKCRVGNVQDEKCPAWQKLREVLAVGGADLAIAVGDRFAVRLEDDSGYGEVGVPYVGHGDGAIGPIARKLCSCRRYPLEAVALACQSCQFKACERSALGSARGDERQKRNDNADKPNQGADKSNQDAGIACRDGSEKVHGGIIAFLKRCFGRGERE